MVRAAGFAMRSEAEQLGSFHYSISIGVNAFTHFMAGALGQFGINVNAIPPGITMTEPRRSRSRADSGMRSP
jgi:NAD(P)-dependent dehydrogenase (short-subunit alcohol dehydrogenase family)